MEPLAESSQFAEILRQVLKYRRQKALQLELTRDTLQAKSAQLTTLEKSEQEARRIEGALARIEGSQILPQTPRQPARSPSSPPPQAVDTPSSPEQERDDDDFASSPTKPKPRKRLSSVGKVFGFGKLNYAMKGIIDVDPETTRRNNIGKTRETIAQVSPITPSNSFGHQQHSPCSHLRTCVLIASWNPHSKRWMETLKLHQNKSGRSWSDTNGLRRPI